LPEAVILQVPPFDPNKASGGAEVIAAILASGLALTGRFNVTVICGAEGVTSEPRVFAGVEVLPGLILDDDARAKGVFWPALRKTASNAISSADVVVSVERAPIIASSAKRLVLLGGIGYPHSYDLIRNGSWDALAVPSEDVAARARAEVPLLDSLWVIPNGIDASLFREAPVFSRVRDIAPLGNPTIKLVMPSRPVFDKGFQNAMNLLTALREAKRHAELTLFSQESAVHQSNVPDLVQDGDGEASYSVRPWLPRSDMPAAYREADITLALSIVAEGFGLTAVESVMSGTPAVVTPMGNLPHLLPPRHGIFVLPSVSFQSEWISTIDDAIQNGRRDCVERGRPAVIDRYSVSVMIESYARLIDSVLSGEGTRTKRA
jgi:glycosyltransferase involved in cell wall biosynthesis